MKKLLMLLAVVTSFFVLSLTAFAEDGKENYLVKFERIPAFNDYSPLGIDAAEVKHDFDTLDMIEVELTKGQVVALENNPNVAYVEEDIPVYAHQQEVPYGITRVQSPSVHQGGHTGSGTKLAILDTGIDAYHEDLNVSGGYSVFASGWDANPFYDGNGHGTHVAGTAAALDNGTGVVGVAPGADLYAVKVLAADGSGSASGVVKGIEWAVQNGIDVINMSLGSSVHSQAIQDAVDAAYYEYDILVVAAAGNDGNSFGTGDSVDYPARYDSTVAVAATDQNDGRAYFSSTGPAVDISAPGVSILSTVPGNGYYSLNGTSMAAPHVAGGGAVLRSAFPDASAAEIRNMMESTAKNIGTNDAWYGMGLMQLDDAID